MQRALWIWVLFSVGIGCGDLLPDRPGPNPSPPLVCPFDQQDVFRPGGQSLEPATRPDRIEVKLEVRQIGALLQLAVSFYNPYRCHWTGDLFLEREGPNGDIETITRLHGASIPGGGWISGRVIMPPPDDNQPPPDDSPHFFVARAYDRNGHDQETYVDCLLDGSECRAPPATSNGPVAWSSGSGTSNELLPCVDSEQQRIDVDLSVRGHGNDVELMTAWRNTTNRSWAGDLYIDYTGPFEGVRVQRRDLGGRVAPGLGFCTYDRTVLPSPGVYRFSARALSRDGSAEARWSPPAGLTTEIFGVCNRVLCESIEPDQTEARLTLTGPSEIHLESDFFSEFTRVLLAHEGREFDITRRCKVEQSPDGAGKNHIVVQFNTFDLPLPPRAWAQYTISLYPMPTIPPGSKLEDSLWVLTNGGE